MVTYYRGRNTLITHREFHSPCPCTRRFQVGDLREVAVTFGRVDRSGGRPLGVTGLLSSRIVWELRAIYHGEPVLLFSSTDERTFGQVKRALVRALEAHMP